MNHPYLLNQIFLHNQNIFNMIFLAIQFPIQITIKDSTEISINRLFFSNIFSLYFNLSHLI